MPLIYPPHDPRRTDRRLYKGGGDGGAGQMRADEQDRQRKVQEAVNAINARFGQGGAPDRGQFVRRTERHYDPHNEVWVDASESFDEAGYNAEAARLQQQVGGNKAAREGMYANISGAVRETAMRDLDRQYSKASRNNLFGLARSGLLGGSADAESGGELQTLYGEGKLKAAQVGQQAGADLRVSDERTRQNLISLAQSGLDTGTAESLAAGQMSAAAEAARGQAAGASVGRLFDDMSQAYVQNQVLKTRYPNGMPQQQQPSTYGSSVFSPSRYTGRVQG